MVLETSTAMVDEAAAAPKLCGVLRKNISGRLQLYLGRVRAVSK